MAEPGPVDAPCDLGAWRELYAKLNVPWRDPAAGAVEGAPRRSTPAFAPPKEFAIPPPPSAELLHELAQQVPVNGSGALQYEAFFDALHVVDCDRLSQVV